MTHGVTQYPPTRNEMRFGQFGSFFFYGKLHTKKELVMTTGSVLKPLGRKQRSTFDRRLPLNPQEYIQMKYLPMVNT